MNKQLDQTKKQPKFKPLTQLDADETAELQRAGLLERFNSLPPSHQREYHKWISEAKKSQTRQARIQKMLNMLSNNQKSSQ